MTYYNKHINEIFTELSTSEHGLGKREANRRLKSNGPNEIAKKKQFDILKSIFSQFTDLLIVILLIAAIISLLLGERTDAIVIIIIVAINSLIGFLQEFKASKSIEALQKLVTPTARIIRDGKEIEVSAKDVVTGDIVILEEGDKIPADARIIQENELRTDESSLTGESIPQRKQANIISKQDIVCADQKNMVFMGTNITHGNGHAIVTATGKETEFGKIASLTKEIQEEKSPLQKEVAYIGKFTAKATAIIGFLVILTGLFIGEGFFKMFFFAVSLAIAVVPEGLPTTLTISLAIGVQRMAKKNAIIRKLQSVETLGSTTVICSDKTGTLTKNEMTVVKIFANNKFIRVSGVGYEPKGDFFDENKKIESIKNYEALFKTAVLCNNAALSEPEGNRTTWGIIGDPTEAALLVAAKKAGFDKNEMMDDYKRLHEMPFDSEKKWMITINEYKGKNHAYLKGAPGEVMDLCDKIMINGKLHRLTKRLREEIIELETSMGSEALRVLGFAYREVDDDFSHRNVEKEFVFLGMMGMMDPPRPDVKEAVKQCMDAGIRINIITGDFGETARAIAKQVGIADDNTQVITGEELEKIDETRLTEILKNEVIFARVSPEHKLRIVTVLQEMGEVVAVTGDGVNDAPSLKKADIGVAMGISGTDVSRESSDMILSDDSFTTIISAVEHGRRIYDNLKKLIFYIFTGITGELFTVLFALIFGFMFKLPLPILAIQILLIDLGAEILPSLALALEPEEKGIMQRQPRQKKYRIINKGMLTRLVVLGWIISIGAIFLFVKTLILGGWVPGQIVDTHSALYAKATTMVFATIIIFQMFNAFNSKTQKESLFKTNILKNPYLIFSVILSTLMIFSFTYFSFFNTALHTTRLTLLEWGQIILISSSILIFEEIRKFFLRNKPVAPLNKPFINK
ncbi:cation-translocating P-type ATPase [Candidatus Woesearchaeota archaeon]|nr:cation-translocating P-type ATPase [Candidatus Woesearchaeota archaeon]